MSKQDQSEGGGCFSEVQLRMFPLKDLVVHLR